MKCVIYIICLLIVLVIADPKPTGGAPCRDDLECGGLDAGICEFNGTHNETGYCVCYDTRGNPDCSYVRKSRDLAGGIQFLCFAGVGGVGDFILGRVGAGVGQVILMSAEIFLIVAACVYCCVAICGRTKIEMMTGILICVSIVVVFAMLAGWIWCVIDAALILEGHIKDGKGYATAPN